jgi:outer membrane murein-binding lipoprotein Lpp
MSAACALAALLLAGACSDGGNPDARSVTDPDARVSEPPPTNRAELLAQLEAVRQDLAAAKPTDVAAQGANADACLRLDATAKAVLNAGDDSFSLTGQEASLIRGADLACPTDPDSARGQLEQLPAR